MLGKVFSVPTNQTLLMAGSIGFAALMINGLLFRRYIKPTKDLDAINITLKSSELLKLQAAANFTIGENQVPGKLFLTQHRLIFISFEQKDSILGEYSWPLTDQQSSKFYPTIFNAGGEFIIHYKNEKLVFEVDELKMWQKALLVK
jgi:hypothetical protein